MTEFIPLRRSSTTGLLRLGDVSTLVDILAAGGLAVLPTETGYMLAALATDEAAVERAFRVKGRSLENPMHVACASLEMARRFAHIEGPAARIMGRFTPGPVTVVVPKRGALPDRLVTLHGTVGLRVPECAATLQVLAALGAPLTATSLNEAGQPSVSIEPDSLATLAWPEDARVPVVEGEDTITQGSASTLVLFSGDDVKILRQGPVSEPEIRAALASS